MKIAVCMKCVPDPNTVEVNNLNGEIDESRLIYTTNPADETALGFAIHLRSKKDQLLAVSIGPSYSDTMLHNARALGANPVTRIWDDAWSETYPLRTASGLSSYLRKYYSPDLILCGNHSTDRGSGSVPALLAEMLGYPIVVSVTEMNIYQQTVKLQRRIDRGFREVVEVDLPVVIAVEPESIQLKEASLPEWIESHKHPIPTLQARNIGMNRWDIGLNKLKHLGIFPRRMPPRPIFTPDSSLTPDKRIDQILNGGLQKKLGRKLEGTHRESALAIFNFLDHLGFLDD